MGEDYGDTLWINYDDGERRTDDRADGMCVFWRPNSIIVRQVFFLKVVSKDGQTQENAGAVVVAVGGGAGDYYYYLIDRVMIKSIERGMP